MLYETKYLYTYNKPKSLYYLFFTFFSMLDYLIQSCWNVLFQLDLEIKISTLKQNQMNANLSQNG